MTPFSIDTNVLIVMWQVNYPPDLFPQVWEAFQSAGSDGQLFVCRQVRDEYKEASLLAWLRSRKELVRPTGAAELAVVQQIMTHPDWCRLVDPQATSQKADPYVIAHAVTTGGTVVTDERPRAAEAKRPHIPDVCSALSVHWIRTPAFVRWLLEL